jgi:hypothetical protein
VEDYFGIIIFIIIALFSILGGRKKPQQPVPRPDRQEQDDEHAYAEPDEEEAAARHAEVGRYPPAPGPAAESTDGSESASDMVPSDLWELLTGERRSQPGPYGRPAPVPGPEAGRRSPPELRTPPPELRRPPPDQVRDAPEEVRRAPEEVRRLPPDPGRPRPPPARAQEVPERPAPVVVSIEELDPVARRARETAERRRDRPPAHRRPVPAVRATPVPRPARPRIRDLLVEPADLKRAMILREILDRPKGLD